MDENHLNLFTLQKLVSVLSTFLLFIHLPCVVQPDILHGVLVVHLLIILVPLMLPHLSLKLVPQSVIFGLELIILCLSHHILMFQSGTGLFKNLLRFLGIVVSIL